MVDVTSPLLAEELTFHLRGTAPVRDGRDVPVGTSHVDRDGLIVRDLDWRPVLQVGRPEFRFLRNDRYPVYDGRPALVGWLGAFEGVVIDGKRVAAFATQRKFSSSCHVCAVGGSRPQHELASIDHLPLPGHRTAFSSDDWRVHFGSTPVDGRLRLMIAAAPYVWHVGRGEE